MGAARRRRAVLDAGRARPARLRLDRSVRGARRGGRRHRADRAGDDDRHRPAAERGAARQAGGVGRCALGRSGSRSGLAVGARLDDYEAAGVEHRGPRPAPLRAARGAAGTATASASAKTCGCSSAAWSAPRSRAWRATPTAMPTAAARRARSPARRPARSPRGAISAAPGARCCGARATSRSATRTGRGVPARLLRLHRPVRRADRRRQPHLRARDPRLRARLRGGRAATSSSSSRPSRTSRNWNGWPRCWREGPRHRRRPGRPLPGDPAQEGRPQHDVAVVERNAPDATFGLGVVFSEETLGALRDADPETHLEITDTFARWPAIDIHYRGRPMRSRGHAFSAIPRKLLLQILQRRARGLGVELRFESEVSGLPAADLVVGRGRREQPRADDVRERTSASASCRRAASTSGSAPTSSSTPSPSSSRRPRPGSSRSTRIPSTSTRARGSSSAPSTRGARWASTRWTRPNRLEACEAMFAEELQGHRLMSNRSLWMDFLLVRNESWHRGNVVLLGDAAHTAHFSIGSGTKLAMEDAIALAQAFQRHPGDLERALVDYELERQPVVERFQQAAGRERRLLRARGAIRAHGPDAVRVQPAHAQRPHHAREPRPARPAVRPRARRVVPRRRRGCGRAAAAVRAVARAAQPSRARGSASRTRWRRWRRAAPAW